MKKKILVPVLGALALIAAGLFFVLQRPAHPPAPPAKEGLEALGFDRIPKTDLFRLEGLVVGVKEDQSQQFFQDVPLSRKPDRIVRFGYAAYETTPKWERVFAQFDDDGKDFRMVSVNGSGGTGKPVGPRLTGDLTETGLAKIGFKRTPLSLLVYGLQEDGRHAANVYVLLEGGRLAAVLTDLDDTRGKIGPSAKVVAVKKHRDGATVHVRSGSKRLTIGTSSAYTAVSGFVWDETPSLEELRIVPFPPKSEGGFVLGGKNSTTAIRELKALNKQPIEKLEQRMRPGAYSRSGFLTADESLIDVLAADNDDVLGRGFTHQKLVVPLRVAIAIGTSAPGRSASFTFKGRQFRVEVETYRGSQESPFHDGTSTNIDVEVTNVKTGKKLSFSGLLPDMIERYGFYEGRVSYRLNPRDIIETFELTPNE